MHGQSQHPGQTRLWRLHEDDARLCKKPVERCWVWRRHCAPLPLLDVAPPSCVRWRADVALIDPVDEQQTMALGRIVAVTHVEVPDVGEEVELE